MPHRLPKLSSLALLLFLNLVLASPALFGRDEPGGNSLWGLDLEDVFGAGAAELDALYRLWGFSTAPGVTTTPSGVPSEPPDERSYQPPETPSPVAFPPFNPTAMKTCATAGEGQGSQVDRLAVEQSWWRVEQEPETGYVAPLTQKNKDNGYNCLWQSRGKTERNEERENTDLSLYTGDL